MCCETSSHHTQSHGHSGACGCGEPACFGPALWSKQKRIQMVEHSIKCFQSKIRDLEDVLQELHAEQ